jgi:type VI secretion system protein ImpK
MSTKANMQSNTVVDIDVLLQDSYLLVVELRQGASAQDSEVLWAGCKQQIEHVRGCLEKAGLSERSIEHICYAQCALLDETLLGCAIEDAHSKWANKPLQAEFFNRHQAGESLYEDMREVLRAPAPDLHVLTAFQRVLMLGFQGRYRDVNDPEREQLLAALNAQVTPLRLDQGLTTCRERGARLLGLRWLQSTLAHAVLASVLLVGVWWGLDHQLGRAIATLFPG